MPPQTALAVKLTEVFRLIVVAAGDGVSVDEVHGEIGLLRDSTVEPAQHALFGRMLIEPEVIRMLIFGLALVLIMLFRPAGLLPSAVRKRELTERVS